MVKGGVSGKAIIAWLAVVVVVKKRHRVGSDELYVAAAAVMMGRYNSWKSIPKMRVVSTVSNMSAFYSIPGCQ